MQGAGKPTTFSTENRTMLSISLSYIFSALPLVAYIIAISYSLNFMLYIAGRVSLTFAGIYVLGAYATVLLAAAFSGSSFSVLPFLAALLIASLMGAVMSIVIYAAYERFLKADAHRMIATFSIITIFSGIVKLVWGTNPITYTAPLLKMGVSEISGNVVPNYYFFMFGATMLLMFALAYFLRKTSWGLRFRASSLDGDRLMAQACGVNQHTVTILTFAISGVLASLAGGLYAPIAGAVYGIEANALLLASLAVIIGGVGSIGGAILTAFMIGLARVITAIQVPVLELAIPFIIACVTLMLKPYGLWGREFKH
jgi:branched-chain amino acid transport system permease protein